MSVDSPNGRRHLPQEQSSVGSNPSRRTIHHQTKNRLLGEHFGTASHRLRRALMFSLVQRLGEDICFRCGEKIVSVKEFTIEHKASWQLAVDPIVAFFDLSNIAFSHSACNYGAGARPTKKWSSKKEADAAHNKKNQAKRIVRKRAWRQERRDRGLKYS